MALNEQSMFWTTNDTGDGPAAGYDDDRWQDFLKTLLTPGADKQGVYGVFSNEGDELECSATGNVITVGTGKAMVCGFFYENTASGDLTAVAVPAATCGGHVYLEVDWSAQTVRLGRTRSSSGVTDIPALTQTEGTTWQIRLYEFQITAGGIITLTDVREFINPPQALVYTRQGGDATTWRDPGTTEYKNQTGIIQVGAVEWTGSAAASGNIDISFSKAFSGAPVVFCNCMDDTDSSNIICNAKAWYTTYEGEKMTIFWETKDGGNRTSILFSWQAIGPE